ncbi:uncharacterized protein LOC126088219 [Schistocerca cancellata]|uniref:uncharacterized protein LOC126088219 n=1 Tax=Schistocerca cancellata TaxID=274614 RepID=UPI0021190135|nr:uncharacterized protein LOC126088219 [Schistocerca cancellata]
MYEADEALYNVRQPDYKNRLRRLKSYTNLSEVISRDIRPGCMAEDIKKKIDGLRTSYSYEKAKMHKSKSGASAQAAYTPQVYWFHVLKFLDQATEADESVSVTSKALKVKVLDQHLKKCLSIRCKSLLSHVASHSHSSNIKSGLAQKQGRHNKKMVQMVLTFNTELFIDEIEKRPAIWNMTSSIYSDKNLRRRTWEELRLRGWSTITKFCFFPASSLRKVWKCLRDNFTREVKKMKTVKSGSGTSKNSSNIHYNILLFL